MVHLFSIKYPLKSKREKKRDLFLTFLLALKKNKQ